MTAVAPDDPPLDRRRRASSRGATRATRRRRKKRHDVARGDDRGRLIAFLWTIPTFGLLISSFRPAELIQTSGLVDDLQQPRLHARQLPRRPVLAVAAAPQLGASFVNSLAITIPVTIFPLVVRVAGRLRVRVDGVQGPDLLFISIFALQIVPIQMALVPLLRLFSIWLRPGQAWLHDLIPIIPVQNYLPLWIAHTIFALPLTIFLLHNFISEIPGDVIEAARVDGASHSQIFFRIILPLATPAHRVGRDLPVPLGLERSAGRADLLGGTRSSRH